MVSGGISVLFVVENDTVEVVVVDGVVFMVVAAVVVFCMGILGRTGMVVFHWWVEKGLVTLGGSVISWSPTVDR